MALVLANSTPPAPIAPVIPTQATPTQVNENAWLGLLGSGFGDNSTPLPTVAIPTQPVIVPTLPASRSQVVSAPVSAVELANNNGQETINAGATPTLPSGLSTTTNANDDDSDIAIFSITREPNRWNPPPLEPPLSRHPLGRDHFILRRPMDSNVNNRSLFFYPYGADGTNLNVPSLIHHGIDFPNDPGTQVRAAGSGTVLFASNAAAADSSVFQNSASYGIAVFIEHDFHYRGQPIYTLYAHLTRPLVQAGDIVEAGQPIALSGSSGRTSGPHLHFEVRLGGDRYGDTVNPSLWIVPYVGHGVIAGRIVDAQGNFIQDADITIRNWAKGTRQDSTTSYVFLDSVNDVNPDPSWDENFVVPDVPVGRYDVIAEINGERIVRQIEVYEGMTSFVELRPREPVTDNADDN